MNDRALMQMSLEYLIEFGMGEMPTAKALRERLEQPEPTGREVQKMIQAAWKAVRTEYKDDPECCFALGWEAGYGAVAPRVEPPETESGEGFESIPAPPPKQYEPEPVCDKIPQECWSIRCQLGRICKNTAPPKREWIGLTDDALIEEVRKRGFTIRDAQISLKREWVGLTKAEFEEAVEGLEDLEDCWMMIAAKLKEKNT